VVVVAAETTQRRIPYDKTIFARLLKKFLAFYGTGRFITVFTKAHRWTLS
jgi:hypothetical protein